jgi:hypothetical protein
MFLEMKLSSVMTTWKPIKKMNQVSLHSIYKYTAGIPINMSSILGEICATYALEKRQNVCDLVDFDESFRDFVHFRLL